MGVHTVTIDARDTRVRVLPADDPELGDLFDGTPPEGYALQLTGRNDEAVIVSSHIKIAAIVRRLAVEARHRFTGSGVSTRSEYSLPVDVVAAQLWHAGHVPDEDGALLAAGTVVDCLRNAAFDVELRPVGTHPRPSRRQYVVISIGYRSRLDQGRHVCLDLDPLYRSFRSGIARVHYPEF
ncbi:hypothetical protein [Nonomuraea sp. CA-141351]|uniref:hypothetical protein n=1 Tax=Nonomuraea sp. CA-141351 TaxID=3239996 RepID=UPI003D8FD2D5